MRVIIDGIKRTLQKGWMYVKKKRIRIGLFLVACMACMTGLIGLFYGSVYAKEPEEMTPTSGLISSVIPQHKIDPENYIFLGWALKPYDYDKIYVEELEKNDDKALQWKAEHLVYTAEEISDNKAFAFKAFMKAFQQNLIDISDEVSETMLYPVWESKLVITDPVTEDNPKIKPEDYFFYEGEYVSKSILLWGYTASDKIDGDLTGKLQVKKLVYRSKEGDKVIRTVINPTSLNTTVPCRVEMTVAATNSRGSEATLTAKFDIRENKAPKLTTLCQYVACQTLRDMVTDADGDKDKERKLFTDFLVPGMSISDDVENLECLRKNFSVKMYCSAAEKKEIDLVKLIQSVQEKRVTEYWTESEDYRTGKFEIRVKDQYGHRFYMNDGEKKQYGSGKTTVSLLDLNVAGYSQLREGYTRFVSEEYYPSTFEANSIWVTDEEHKKLLLASFKKDGSNDEDCMQIWEWTSEDIKKVKELTAKYGSPWVKEAREEFAEKFAHCRKK